ncbi:MAG: cobalamin B12-binding domain-containing protein [Methanophagales archaeon]|nr:cobalamin B12-binding domain-containing protein [Methanophagales archaeon]
MGDIIVDALLDVTKKRIETFCEERLNNGMAAYEIIDELTQGLRAIGEGYRARYFDAELIVSGWNAKKALRILKPFLHGEVKEVEKKLGKVVIGTVKGDVHDIGKEIVSIMLSSGGFEVIDLGIDVDKERYASAVKETGADILALSALLTTTRDYMAEVIEYFRSIGPEVKIMVGGGALSADYANEIGADAYGKDAVEAVRKAKELLK